MNIIVIQTKKLLCELLRSRRPDDEVFGEQGEGPAVGRSLRLGPHRRGACEEVDQWLDVAAQLPGSVEVFPVVRRRDHRRPVVDGEDGEADALREFDAVMPGGAEEGRERALVAPQVARLQTAQGMDSGVEGLL